MAIRKIGEFVEASSPQNSDKLLIERNGSGKSITVGNLLNDVVTRTRVNLLSPMLVTTTLNGITATSNGDGTYTLNGTATGNTKFFVQNITLNKYKDKKMIGCPDSGSEDSYSYLIDYFNNNNEYQTSNIDSGNGLIISDYPKIASYFFIKDGTTLNNIVFKPMITDDLSATYDDFVSYDDSFIMGINSGINLDLLWTNLNPTSSFISQNLSMNLTKYRAILIEVCEYGGVQARAETYFSNIVFKGVGGSVATYFYSDGKCLLSFIRTLHVLDDRVYISNSADSHGVNNVGAIPQKIWGIK